MEVFNEDDFAVYTGEAFAFGGVGFYEDVLESDVFSFQLMCTFHW